MGEEPTGGKTAVIMDINGLIQAVRDEVTDQVRFVVSLNPTEPSVAFTIPDCGSEEMGYKLRAAGTVLMGVVDQVFRWTTEGNYEHEDGEDHDPSIA